MPKKFEDWTPPWKDDEFDAEMAAKLIFNLETDKEKLGEQKATAISERDAAVTTRDQLQTAIDAKAREGESAEQKAERLERENAELRAKPVTGAVTPEIQQARLMAALSVDGISAADALVLAQFIQGNTEDEAKVSATTFVEKFGIPGQSKETGQGGGGDGGGGDEDEDNPLHSRPRGRVNNPLDPRERPGGEKPVTELLSLIPRG